MLPFIILLVVVGMGNTSDPNVEPVVQRRLEMRNCLTEEVRQEMSQWLTEVRDWKHHQFLESQGLLVLNLQLKAGVKLCGALEMALHRIVSKHNYVLAQRKSASIPIVEHDGWQEAQVKLKEFVKGFGARCLKKGLDKFLPRYKVRETIKCMVLAEKKASATLMAYHMD